MKYFASNQTFSRYDSFLGQALNNLLETVIIGVIIVFGDVLYIVVATSRSGLMRSQVIGE
jgi:hypothetical protein